MSEVETKSSKSTGDMLFRIIGAIAVLITAAVAAISLYRSMTGPSAGGIIGTVVDGVIGTTEARSSDNIEQVKQLIHEEAAAALAADIDGALSLYTPNYAVVRDAISGESWQGLQQIRDRYSKLPQFTKLDHVDIQVTLEPGGNSASAVASTSGEMLTNGGVTPVSSFRGEYWTFQKVEGTWRIETFTYAAR
ncbi:MAG: nuclear transport factor 2 family protein [Dehalococcoidia bacterium]|jgi:ketosteroid isomerase-like protein